MIFFSWVVWCRKWERRKKRVAARDMFGNVANRFLITVEEYFVGFQKLMVMVFIFQVSLLAHDEKDEAISSYFGDSGPFCPWIFMILIVKMFVRKRKLNTKQKKGSKFFVSFVFLHINLEFTFKMLSNKSVQTFLVFRLLIFNNFAFQRICHKEHFSSLFNLSWPETLNVFFFVVLLEKKKLNFKF